MDLDDILNQALDDFEEQELNDKVKQAETGDEDQIAKPEHIENEEDKARQHMEELMAGLNDPVYGKSLQETLKSLSSTSDGVQNVDQLFEQLAGQFETNLKPSYMPNDPNNKEEIATADREVAATMQMISSSQQGMEGFEAGKMEAAGEQMMDEMMSQFESLGEKEDYNEVIDGVMRQLLSKDLMYEPCTQICDRFPEWLAIHKKNMSSAEYENYGKQYQTFQKIIAVYDTEPDNFSRLMELMFDMQKYGQPPADIIKDLAPGLKFDENGMPIMPNMGAGMFPEMPGGEGLPNLAEMAGKMQDGQCTIC
mmetsp:Transcript_11904/g.19889  ORF Transcript_11904/g.19889 Transcript_11904/m.19889 type:complete len:309 (+) Transcript_11904:119-1045(+)